MADQPSSPSLPPNRAALNGIARLRSELPRALFLEIVQRLIRDESISEVARYAMTQDRGALNQLTFETMRKYITYLDGLVEEEEKLNPELGQHLSAELVESEKAIANRAAIHGVQPVSRAAVLASIEREIKALAKNITAKDVLTYAFAEAVNRHEFCKSVQAKFPVPMEAVDKSIELIRRIGESMGKLEAAPRKPGSSFAERDGELRRPYDPDGIPPLAPSLLPLSAVAEAVDKMKVAEYAQVADTVLHLDELVENKEVIAKLQEQRARALERKRRLDEYRKTLEEMKKAIEASEKPPAPPEPTS